MKKDYQKHATSAPPPVLPLAQGSTENTTVVTDLLTGLRARGALSVGKVQPRVVE